MVICLASKKLRRENSSCIMAPSGIPQQCVTTKAHVLLLVRLATRF